MGRTIKRAKRRIALRENYNDRYWNWRKREPAWWRIFARIRWRSEEPKKPKWLQEEDLIWRMEQRWQ